MPFQPENSYAELDARLSSSCSPTKVLNPQWIAFNEPLAKQLQLPQSALSGAAGLATFSGTAVPDWAQPTALAYAGHQFGNFVPQLGDGRAVLLSEVLDHQGSRFDIQLKGSGRTPYSRGGDGRSPLGPVLREYLVSEAMHRLEVPTTRALAAIATGEMVQREHAQPGAILTRVASSHLRVGTAQFVAAHKDRELLQRFADYVIERHYPHCAAENSPYLALLTAVIDRQASLIAKWMSLGFIHGVMNTDNMTLSGETIDYGPCAFMEAYDPAQVFSSIDRRGRYSYQNQPAIAMWNLARFAETLLPLIDQDPDTAIARATAAVENFDAVYQRYYSKQMSAKLGLSASDAATQQLLEDYLDLMQQQQVDFTLAFRFLGDADNIRSAELFQQHQDWQDWYQRWRQALAQQHPTAADASVALNSVNPAYIPRNHLIEAAISEATNDGSLELFNRLQHLWQSPFVEQPEASEFMRPANQEQQVKRTFCGT
ncbi:hypothetical protein PSI9734_00731 [Pseudidiomarina piscicola]|uniref:Protein nucleotidyltransferase YdiU n=1 Tax=Pseudidiomarina piscicola TaxID=2614830 RepID=A0A6S6WQU3_9GAMM|nr:YdiU family protein [Pseudidiomarina piscicola]CAB0150164.1 hypothetical protein PSI9734_00731 [Pseudidiomarina piscicola]VZT39603.1 hypothetical protein PSI9734_00731 [Pseudomonas aeruginosa]